jgi:uncharacterized protein (TIGR02996 family)
MAPKRPKSKRRRPKVGALPDTEALDQAITAEPKAVAPWLVLGDLLQAGADPRGELISVQHALEAAKGQAWVQLKLRERELLELHSGELFGPLAKWPRLRSTRVWWRRGYAQALSSDGFRTPGALVEFLEHPSGRFVEHLAGVPPRPSGMALLRSLTADDFDLARLPGLPRLERIDAALSMPRGAASTSLRELVVRGVDGDVLAGLRQAQLPALEALSLDHLLAEDVEEAVATVEALERVQELQICLASGYGDASDFSGLARIAPRITGLGFDRLWDPSSLSKLELSKVTSLAVQSGVGDGELFSALPALPSLRRVSLFLPSDRIRYLRAFATSTLAKTLRELRVYLGKPGAALALTEGNFEALQSLDVRFDDTFSAEYLRVGDFLAAKCWAGVKTLRLAPAEVGCLNGTPLAQSVEVLRVPLTRGVGKLGFLPRLVRLVVEVDGAFEPADYQKLGALPCEVALVPAFESGLSRARGDLD